MWMNKKLYEALKAAGVDDELAAEAASSVASVGILEERIEGQGRELQQFRWVGSIGFAFVVAILLFLAREVIS